MPRRVPLPKSLAREAFGYGEGRAAGIGEGRLRGRDLERPFYGVRAPAGSARVERSDLRKTLDVCARFAPLLTPERFYSHETAARLWHFPLPERTDGITVTVSALAPHNAPRGRNVIGHRADPGAAGVVSRYGFPVSDAESTWLAMAAQLPVDELVVCADHLILDPHLFDPRDPRPYSTIDRLRERASGFTGRGARAARSALDLSRPGSESRPESLLRLLLHRAGLPDPRLNVDITDSRGRFLGRGDLVWPTWRAVAEYDGDHHRTDTAQYDHDILRIEQIVAAGWRVVRVRSRGLFVTPIDTIARVREALDAGGWHPTRTSRPRSTSSGGVGSMWGNSHGGRVR